MVEDRIKDNSKNNYVLSVMHKNHIQKDSEDLQVMQHQDGFQKQFNSTEISLLKQSSLGRKQEMYILHLMQL